MRMGEDIDTETVEPGSWRAEGKPRNYLLPVANRGSNRAT
jgi:hypothetical protein